MTASTNHSGFLHPLRVAIIGSGPSGFYAAEALLKQQGFKVQVDMFDRLPTPYGLVRGGVAPDHQKIKSVIAVYEKIAAMSGFRFFGNVALSRDISVEDLRRCYDQIVYAVGCEKDRSMGIPGEDLARNHSATAFVGWYNGHPDYRHETFDLSCEKVAVVGVGNVAMDVTRILAENPEHLAKTDIAPYALEALRRSRVKEIYLLGRRGPAQAAFSLAEIQELGHLEGADLVVRPQEAAIDEVSKPELSDPVVKKKTDYLISQSGQGMGSKPKKIYLRFCVSPVEVLGSSGKVQTLKLEKNILLSDGRGGVKAKGTGEFETIPVSLVFRSIGYHGVPIAGVPFDTKSGHIPNDQGRVLDSQTRQVRPGEYVVGWAKRGPSGLIGTNRQDSYATVNLMLEDAMAHSGSWGRAEQEDISQVLAARGIRAVTFADWKVLDRLEVERGARFGKIREKFTSVEEMLASLTSEPV